MLDQWLVTNPVAVVSSNEHWKTVPDEVPTAPVVPDASIELDVMALVFGSRIRPAGEASV
jgi:hypothetical protein